MGPRAAMRRRPVEESAMVEKASEPPGVVPTRRLYDSPALGVSSPVGPVQLSVTVADTTVEDSPVGAAGGVFAAAALFLYTRVMRLELMSNSEKRKSRSPSLS